MRYCSIDLETTGTDPRKHQIIEFGAVLDDLKNPKPIEELPRFHTYILQEDYIGSPFALSMHPKIFRRIALKEKGYNYMHVNKLGKAFKKFLIENGYEERKNKEGQQTVFITPAGKNFASFDRQFLLETNFRKSITMSHKTLDPGNLYVSVDDEEIPGTSECYLRAGLNPEVAHTALEDAIGMIELIRKKLLKVE